MSKIIVYQHVNFQGLSKEFHRDVPNLVNESFNDCISSLKVIGQPWVAYEHVNYAGQQRVYEEGEHASVDGNDSFSSLKIIMEDLENPEIVLFQHANFQGRQVVLNTETNLTFASFNDEVSSHIVNRGAWVLYEHTERNGRQIVSRMGESVANYNDIEFNDRVSHVRPLKSGRPVVKAKILWDQMVKENERNLKIDEIIGVNRTDTEQSFSTSATKEYESTISQSVSFSNSTTITAGTTFSMDIVPGISMEANLSVSNTFTVEKGKTESTTQKETSTLNMPSKITPHTKLTVNVIRKEVSVRVPVEFTVTQGKSVKTEYGEYRCSSGKSVYAEFNSEKV
ncbi:epidermal differentiation-specific protein-like [Huso huso]|uniref:Epidermal differentiation-specific protein-like n=1 Tax=Huso huso TaxID=61971 RepID=A0ABR0ZEQ6_HUSHU